GLARSGPRRLVRDRLGRRPEVHGGLHAPDPDRADRRQHGRQPRPARPFAEDLAFGHRLRGLDRRRDARHGRPRHRPVRGSGGRGAARLHRPDRGGHRRPQAGVARL
ncbi:MAG: small multidrug resistance family (SMR) protein, partial [uncultured Acetobacteraceae bacterium]